MKIFEYILNRDHSSSISIKALASCKHAPKAITPCFGKMSILIGLSGSPILDLAIRSNILPLFFLNCLTHKNLDRL